MACNTKINKHEENEKQNGPGDNGQKNHPEYSFPGTSILFLFPLVYRFLFSSLYIF
jgi:hypothetical protein